MHLAPSTHPAPGSSPLKSPIQGMMHTGICSQHAVSEWGYMTEQPPKLSKKKKSYFCSFCRSRSEKPQMHFSLQPWWDRNCCPARTCSSKSPTNSVKSFCQEPLAEGTELIFFQPTAWPQSNLSFCHGDSFIYLKSHITLEHTHPHLHEFSLRGLTSHCST